jgi:alkylation response protein AidB-like acyl-CoA dehydrogenase
MQRSFRRVVEVCQNLERDGVKAIDNPLVRQKLGEIYGEIEVLRYASLRILSRLEKGLRPGPEASIAKLHYSELDRYVQELFLDILGPYGQQMAGLPQEFSLNVHSEEYGEQGSWAYQFFWSRAGTIYAGSSEIQKNIIGERVLGLPKEVREDRIALAQKAAAGD